jgi:hypothetical protein
VAQIKRAAVVGIEKPKSARLAGERVQSSNQVAPCKVSASRVTCARPDGAADGGHCPMADLIGGHHAQAPTGPQN